MGPEKSTFVFYKSWNIFVWRDDDPFQVSELAFDFAPVWIGRKLRINVKRNKLYRKRTPHDNNRALRSENYWR